MARFRAIDHSIGAVHKNAGGIKMRMITAAAATKEAGGQALRRQSSTMNI